MVRKQSQKQRMDSSSKNNKKSDKLQIIQNVLKVDSKQKIKKQNQKRKQQLFLSSLDKAPKRKTPKSEEQQNAADYTQMPANNEDLVTHSNDDHRSLLLWDATNDEPAFDASLTSSVDDDSTNSIHISSIFANAINQVLVLLKETIYLYGHLQLKLLAGSVDIYGYSPQLNEKLQIFSPRGLSTVSIKPQPTKTAFVERDDFWEQLSKLWLSTEVDKIRENFNPHQDALLILESNYQAKQILRTFQICFNENVFPNFNYTPSDRLVPVSEAILHCRIDFECDKALKVPSYWKLLNLCPTTRMLIAGGISVGKSTLLRHLVNRHLASCREILVIDLDIGQPELFVPQTISCTRIRKPLLGSGYFYNIQPEQAYFIGECSIAICAGTYLRAVRKLLEYCHNNESLANLPWVVNTMGYNKGFGLELIAAICAYLQPTDVVQLQSNKPINNFDQKLTQEVMANLERLAFCKSWVQSTAEPFVPRYQYHELPTAVQQESRFQKEWTMTRKDMRYAIMMSWLSLALPKDVDYFNDVEPVVIHARDIQIFIREQKEWQLSNEALLEILKCAIVHLCHKDVNDEDDAPACIGIGLTRAINVEEKKIYLLPALPDSSLLSKVNCLAVGSMPIPSAFHLNQSARVKGKIPFVYSTLSSNATRPIKQIYHRPAEFLSGMRKKEKR